MSDRPLAAEAALAEAIHETCDWEHYMGHEPSERDDMLAASLLPALERRGYTLTSLDAARATPVDGLLDGGPCFYCRHGDRAHHSTAFPRWCGECHCRAYAPTSDAYLQALVELRRAALAADNPPPDAARSKPRTAEALRAYQQAVIQVPGIEDGVAHEPWQERLRNVISRYGGVR